MCSCVRALSAYSGCCQSQVEWGRIFLVDQEIFKFLHQKSLTPHLFPLPLLPPDMFWVSWVLWHYFQIKIIPNLNMSFPHNLLTILNNSVEHLLFISSVLPETLRAGFVILLKFLSWHWQGHHWTNALLYAWMLMTLNLNLLWRLLQIWFVQKFHFMRGQPA